MNKIVKFSLIGVAAFVSFIGTSQAALIVQYQSFSTSYSFESSSNLQGASTVNLNNYFDGNTSFNMFDGDLGTLDSVQIDITNILMDGDASTLFSDSDNGGRTSGLSALQNLHLDFSSPGFASSRFSSGIVDRCSDGPRASGASCWTNLSLYSLSSQINATLGGSSLGDYIGLGLWTLNIHQIGRIFNNEIDGDNGYVNYREASLTSSGDIKVTYNYTVAPPPSTEVAEPATFAIFAVGFAGLCFGSRLRKQS